MNCERISILIKKFSIYVSYALDNIGLIQTKSVSCRYKYFTMETRQSDTCIINVRSYIPMFIPLKILYNIEIHHMKTINEAECKNKLSYIIVKEYPFLEQCLLLHKSKNCFILNKVPILLR